MRGVEFVVVAAGTRSDFTCFAEPTNVPLSIRLTYNEGHYTRSLYQ